MIDQTITTKHNTILLVLVGLTGTGKSTTVKALRDQGYRFQLLPDRRELTDQLIITPIQQNHDQPVVPVTDRAQRFIYTRSYRELFPGGMAHALAQYKMNNEQCKVCSIADDCTLDTEDCLLIFDGLRGENEIAYAAQAMPDARFLFLDAPDFVRLQRLLRRNDVFDQVDVSGMPTPADDWAGTAVSLDPNLTNWLDDQQLAKLEYYIDQGELTLEDVLAKLTIVQKERQNYDPDATLAALRQFAPDRLMYANTARQSPDEIAQQVIKALAEMISSWQV